VSEPGPGPSNRDHDLDGGSGSNDDRFLGMPRQRFRERVVDANDGIIATAGIVEGFFGAGATETTVVIGAFAATIAGALAIGGAQYSEMAVERDSFQAVIDEERRQLELSPEEEFDELVDLYKGKGLSTRLAREVAGELTAHDALAAQLDAEHGIAVADFGLPPALLGIGAGIAYAFGAAIPLLLVIVTPDEWRTQVTFVAVVLSLTLTSTVVARVGKTSPMRTIARTVLIGMLAMGATWLGGTLFR
jgi:vacuolar iron transporter family protein